MPRLLKTIITTTIILINLAPSFCQTLIGLPYNHAVLNAVSKGDKNLHKAEVDSIHFDSVFFDDFSDYYYTVFPDSKHWADKDVYINSTYPDSMISMGVATLDAFDEFGYPYYSVDSPYVSSDTLTSQPFIFIDTLKKKVFFSFFFQPGGKGDLPEGITNNNPDIKAKDTLILEFYSPLTQRWDRAFSTIDNSDTFNFNQVVIRVMPDYLYDGFRFRFRNYTSMSSDYQYGEDMGKFSNADMWHIDYIQMIETDDSVGMYTLRDISIVKPILPSLTEYTAIPCRHLTYARTAIESTIMPITFRNFDPNYGATFEVYRNFLTKDLVKDSTLFNKNYHNPVYPFEQWTFRDELRANIGVEDDDTFARFERIFYIEPDIGVVQPTVNDTVKRMEVYHDQYAYDDGSAEFGFGVGGENEDNLRIAQKYRVFCKNGVPDTLKAILIYFGKSVDSSTLDYSYSISIRKTDGDLPAAQNLYTSEVLYPDYSNGINEFTRVNIPTDPPLLISDQFFVVINQLDGYLNIGYDINNDNLDKIYTYSNQTWTNPYSTRPGSLMIRPSFGDYSLPTELEDFTAQSDKLSIYPNPVSDVLYLNLNEDHSGVHDIQIVNIMGMSLMHYSTDELSIAVSDLNPGMYLIVVSSPDKKYIRTAKFIKE